MKYQNVLFDLDGTLTDPYLGITNSIKYALDKFGIAVKDEKVLRLCIGPPLKHSFAEYFHLDAGDTEKAIGYYREYYSEKGMYENKLYAGIEGVLQKLQGMQKNCVMATSKDGISARKIAQHFNIDKYFAHIVGSNLDGTVLEKDEVIAYIFESYPLKKDGTLMVGDRKYDIIGAKKNGIDSIGVLYGYGSREEFEKDAPTYMCETVEGLLEIII
jgi:phosphoglycolate phosphatase